MGKAGALSLIVSLLCFASCTTRPIYLPDDRIQDVEIIAHRGASLRAPENTYASVVRAWQLNADAVEIDIRITGDNHLIALHDFSTLRTTGTHLAVSQTKYEDIETLDAGSYMSANYTGEKIPLLTELLESVPAGKRLFIEWKGNTEDIRHLTDLLMNTGLTEKTAVISFNQAALIEIKKKLPSVPCYLLKVTCPEEKLKKTIFLLNENSLDGLDIYHPSITEEIVKALHNEGLSCIGWTVNTLNTARRLISWGIDGITTNKPGRFAEHLY